MKKLRLVSAIYNDYGPFDRSGLFNDYVATKNPDDLKEGDCLVVWGGADISPTLYNKEPSLRTYASAKLSSRDAIEWALMQRAKELNLPIIGVCRGAQMLCALAGGFLIQDVDNHFSHHDVTTFDGYEITVNSIHHQMMYPFDVKHEMLASCKIPRSKHHLDVHDFLEIKEEPEFVYFPEIRGFAIQWHPEIMSYKSNATQFIFQELVKRMP